jgi:hypothetical protein
MDYIERLIELSVRVTNLEWELKLERKTKEEEKRKEREEEEKRYKELEERYEELERKYMKEKRLMEKVWKMEREKEVDMEKMIEEVRERVESEVVEVEEVEEVEVEVKSVEVKNVVKENVVMRPRKKRETSGIVVVGISKEEDPEGYKRAYAALYREKKRAAEKE